MSPQSSSRTVERFIRDDAATIFDILADPFKDHRIDGSGIVKGGPHGPGRRAVGVEVLTLIHI